MSRLIRTARSGALGQSCLRQNNCSGFTLVELLLVIAIIGVLAAIAIPQFTAYKQRAFCAAEESDLGNLSIVQEAYFGDYLVYSGDIVTLKSLGLATSPGVTLTTATDTTVTPAAFTATADHFACYAPPSQWDSAKGGLL